MSVIEMIQQGNRVVSDVRRRGKVAAAGAADATMVVVQRMPARRAQSQQTRLSNRAHDDHHWCRHNGKISCPSRRFESNRMQISDKRSPWLRIKVASEGVFRE